MFQLILIYSPSELKEIEMSFQDLTADKIAELNQQAWENCTVAKVELSQSEAIELLGLREATIEETPHFVYKGTRYFMERSVTNRPIDLIAVRRLQTMMKAKK